MSSGNDLLIACDVNKSYLVCCKNELDKFSDKVIIDHHNEDASTIDTDTKLILPEKSSASEIMYELLKKFQIKPDCFLANYLLAGIYLDTNKFTKNAECDTMKTVFALTSRGANVGKVNKYFEEDFYSDRRVQDLISKSEFYSYTVALCVGDARIKYLKEELAKAADYLLRYRNVDASFAVGYTDDDVISISARSKGNINVGEIMSGLQGGGHATSAATRLEGSNLEETVKTLKKIYKPKFSIENK
jgi:c-di-AMP phosphodiesterase-like protein